MQFSLCWFVLLTILHPQSPENVGTRIVTRHTSPGGVSEETLYLMADRRRLEFRQSVQSEHNDGTPETKNEFSSLFILRCDLGQSFHLRPKAEEFSAVPYPPKPRTPPKAEQLAAENADRNEHAEPTLRIETTTVDTGERKGMFGYEARHVITTIKQTALDGSDSQSSLSVTDGWYIDLDRSISCDPKPSPGTKRVGVLSVAVGAVGRQRPMNVPQFIDIGARETGLALKETKTFPMSTKFPDGTSKTYNSLVETEVIVLERTPLDPILFEVPSQYKQVEPNHEN
jgi:hypothetical protein